MPKTGFTPIPMDAFVADYLKNNPGEDRAAITAGLKNALDAYKRGVACSCGAPLWVIGSAVQDTAALPASPGRPSQIQTTKSTKLASSHQGAVVVLWSGGPSSRPS